MGNASKLLFLLTSTTPSPFLLHHCPSLLRLARRRHRLAFQRCLSSLSAQYHHHHLPISHSLRHHPLKLKSSRVCIHTAPCGSHSSFASPPDVSQPWPEWTNFLQNLSACGYFNSRPFADGNDDFVSGSDFPEDFVRAASACLAFSRQRPDVLGMLSRKDVDAVVENLTPFIFKNGDDSVRRMELLLNGCNVNELNAGGGCMVDLMKFLLSYISNFVSSKNNSVRSGELVESSVRNLLSELSRHSFNASESNLSEPALNQFPDGHGQTHRPLGQYGEMRRGDWICPRCSFMNFARNARCLDCDETRPKRQLTGGEWECPQCDFFNYGKNMVCLRCDCKRPGEVSIQTANARSDLGYGSESYPYNSDVDSRLAANEEKAQRWFKKVSQLDGAMDKSSAAADEDFPEIMPLRKGVNRFVVSTKKSPLERGRLSNSQYQKSMNIDGNVEPDIIQSTVANQNQTTEILGFQSDATEFDKRFLGNEQNGRTNSAASVSNTASPQHGNLQGGNSKRAPFVPLPADMFAKKPDDSKVNESGKVETDNYKLSASTNGERTRYASEGSGGNLKESWQTSQKPEDHSPSNNKEREQEEKSERWFKRVAELHNVTDLSSVIPDEDFPEIMPLREGENRFVVSKKKDRSLTSPKYKRQMAIEQENSTNFVPFVPFPPDYFAKKGNHQSEEANEASKSTGEKPRKMSDDSTHTVTEASKGQGMENQEHSTTDPNLRHRGQSSNESNSVIAEGKPGSGNSMPTSINPQPSGRYSWSNEDTRKQTISRTPNVRSNSQQGLVSTGSSPKENSLSGIPSENQNFRDGWSGKSLEGSAVKEPDPLDMSEEAKAERWFRRAAQIKDISELSQIPDEDFPEIMPMRKGVNRFVVSKRKTPLERRLTSAQYRKNLPIVSSDPVKRSDS